MVNIRGSTITITKGDTLDLKVEILLPDGSEYPVQPGDVIRFAVKRRYTDREPLLVKVIPRTSMNLRLESEETKLLKAGGVPYVYDIQITMEDGTIDTFIDKAKLFVTEEVD